MNAISIVAMHTQDFMMLTEESSEEKNHQSLYISSHGGQLNTCKNKSNGHTCVSDPIHIGFLGLNLAHIQDHTHLDLSHCTQKITNFSGYQEALENNKQNLSRCGSTVCGPDSR